MHAPEERVTGRPPAKPPSVPRSKGLIPVKELGAPAGKIITLPLQNRLRAIMTHKFRPRIGCT
jgi:hypothetical protein